ncbi:hypothetical protein BURPS1106A_A0379 [Burkholderia pseudomallei 1106a]|uniref:Uncharacterized protein n=1 Tax=Burkholderia pseudomallei (strain 1106a) TaxID=357348 RepID=A3P262_BURP0|nr:hypothetical protein BURPS1106A_A0379 [Burkholderia pseudomallei 1106a]
MPSSKRQAMNGRRQSAAREFVAIAACIGRRTAAGSCRPTPIEAPRAAQASAAVALPGDIFDEETTTCTKTT